jgi:recombination DNA repair RAD52 pathway protein
MALSDTQVRQLRAKLESKHVKTRKANGADLHYVEGWHVIAEANRIFGYDAWDRRTLASHCVWSGPSDAYYGAAYTAKVRVSVRAGDITPVRHLGAECRNRTSSQQEFEARRVAEVWDCAPARKPPQAMRHRAR